MAPHILIAGPMGAGKSTLTQRLADHLGYRAFIEPDGQINPFLKGFYQQMQEVAEGRRQVADKAFAAQIFFLTDAINDAHLAAEAIRAGQGVVQDRHPYEHLAIFAADLHRAGHLSDDEHALLLRIEQVGLASLPTPTVLLHLHAPLETFRQRIVQRGNDYEQGIDPEYLRRHVASYPEWIRAYDKTPVEHLDVGLVDSRTEEGLDRILALLEPYIHRS